MYHTILFLIQTLEHLRTILSHFFLYKINKIRGWRKSCSIIPIDGIKSNSSRSSRSARHRRSLCLHSQVEHHTLDSATFALCRGFLGTLSHSDVGVEWQRYSCTGCEFQLTVKIELSRTVGTELRRKLRTFCSVSDLLLNHLYPPLPPCTLPSPVIPGRPF